jgi:hypothetical protein
VWRATWRAALLLSVAFIARTACDWFVPTTDFHARATFSTWFGVSTLFLVGFWSAWRSASLIAGTFVSIVTSQVAALFSVTGTSLLLAIWHDPETMRAIVGSGGLGEVYLLPFMMIIPAIIVGTIGAAASSVARKLVCAN